MERANQTVFRSLNANGDFSFEGLDNFIRGHFRYRPEREEVIRTPLFMITEMQETGKFEGDCDDVAVMLATLARALGAPARFVAIRYRGDNFEHVFTEIYTGQAWRRFDPTVEKGTQYSEIESMVVSV